LKGIKYGWGRLILAQGHYYIGDFVDNMAQGKGVFFNFNTGSVFVGEFYQNQFNGRGREWYGPLNDPLLEISKKLRGNMMNQSIEEVKESLGTRTVGSKASYKPSDDQSIEKEEQFDEN